MFGCWRRVDAADPDTFITGVAAVLSDYPDHVVSRVTDPRTGLPGKQQFPPSPFEVKQACEAEMAPIRRQQERERRITDTSRMLAAPPEASRPTIEELKERCGPNWGIIPENIRAAILTPQQEKAAANERLAELADEAREPLSVDVSPALRAKLDEMVRNYAHPLPAAAE